ncbi:APC family permease [Armatimonas sp.]|uniref:APC family permease n=1 Tax=Armatimonas sp. TaxID=1872638 RepID=UPI00375103EF
MTSKFKKWFLEGYVSNVEGAFEEEHEPGHKPHPWWQVMCLTGVDYFSTLGYQPGIAFLAAGAISPFATLVLVLLTLLGAYPIYRRVAQESPHGEGSISMLEMLLKRWTSKFMVLILLGFVATDFVITMTLSAADAAAHVRENHFVAHFMEHNPTGWQIGITLFLLLMLGAVFLRGFKEAVGIAVVLTIAYLVLNAVVIGKGVWILLSDLPKHQADLQVMLSAAAPQLFGKPFAVHGSIGLILLAALGLFPKLALGLSGFETGVAVMPLVKGSNDDTEENPKGRIINTRKLLFSAAAIMSCYLIASSFVAALLIPAHEFYPKLIAEKSVDQKQLTGTILLSIHPDSAYVKDPVWNVSIPVQPYLDGQTSYAVPVTVNGIDTDQVAITFAEDKDRLGSTKISAVKKVGKANGRALAYLAEKFFGPGFGTVYDISTILILWFAGASAMAGLLNIVPRYLPRYGMAPEWTRANRPLVMVYMVLAVIVTLIFQADVDAQGGAYATGVLVLMTSAAVAVTIAAHRAGQHGLKVAFAVITAIFVYTTIINIIERSDGLKIASFFIGTIVVLSLLSRLWRVTELRVDKIEFDENAQQMLAQMAQMGEVRFIANHPDGRDAAEYSTAIRDAAWTHHFGEAERWAFLEVYVPDSSSFSSTLRVEGVDVGGFWVLRCYGVAVPNAIASVLLEVQKRHKRRPHVYFNWIESNPMLFLLRFVFFGEGDIAPLTHEILRRNEPDPGKRPIVHAAG